VENVTPSTAPLDSEMADLRRQLNEFKQANLELYSLCCDELQRSAQCVSIFEELGSFTSTFNCADMSISTHGSRRCSRVCARAEQDSKEETQKATTARSRYKEEEEEKGACGEN
jgi:hypothetical protein